MNRWAKGPYAMKNPQKYVGDHDPIYRSSWEWAFMNFCDNNDHVLQWGSECVKIPYRNPLTGKNTVYVPDFLITYRNRDGLVRGELIEIKPRSQSVMLERQSQRDRAALVINHAKWDQAVRWARQHGLQFRVINEEHIFKNGAKKS